MNRAALLLLHAATLAVFWSGGVRAVAEWRRFSDPFPTDRVYFEAIADGTAVGAVLWLLFWLPMWGLIAARRDRRDAPSRGWFGRQWPRHVAAWQCGALLWACFGAWMADAAGELRHTAIPWWALAPAGHAMLVGWWLNLIPLAYLAAFSRQPHLQRASGTCPTCGYDLAGLTAERCPECGHPAAQA